MKKKNIVLIGMPSSGKTTVGKILSDKLNLNFIDTDTIIFEREKKPLRDIVKEDGLDRFLQIQEELILETCFERNIIATGGSVIYSEISMNHLKSTSMVVYLKSTLEEIEKRLGPDRRFAKNSGQSLKDMYNERIPLYEKYAEMTIDCKEKNVNQISKEIVSFYNSL